MLAILSNIHANLAAFEAVIEDAQTLGADRMFVLGDLVGYGPDPIECIDLAQRVTEIVLKGSFDHAATSDDNFEGWSAVHAAQSVIWTRGLIGKERLEYLASLPLKYSEGNQLFVHGTACNPLHGQVVPEDIHGPARLQRIFDELPQLAFVGHSHVLGAIVRNDAWSFDWIDPAEQPVFKVDQRPFLIDVGSVGQPRDCDPRSSYVILDENRITFRRVSYDVDATVRKIRSQPELVEFFAERLLEGR